LVYGSQTKSYRSKDGVLGVQERIGETSDEEKQPATAPQQLANDRDQQAFVRRATEARGLKALQWPENSEESIVVSLLNDIVGWFKRETTY